ncbi:hypothetical protein HJC99_06200 [Candidatus Saccharibacteria bacterium]|nr:hypothetical protein [Candidatus Saccharibacteria bacterium]
MDGFINFLLGVGLVVVIFLAITYVLYTIGLVMVLRRLNHFKWYAFLPFFSYYALIIATGAPKRWFYLSLVPYAGAVYAGSAAIRLGRIFDRGTAFSLFWLTVASPIGLIMIGRQTTPINQAALEETVGLFDIKAIKRSRKNKSAETPQAD